MATLADMVTAMTDLFDFFITLFADLFTTVVTTPIMWVPIAVSLLFVFVNKVPKLVRKLRRI